MSLPNRSENPTERALRLARGEWQAKVHADVLALLNDLYADPGCDPDTVGVAIAALERLRAGDAAGAHDPKPTGGNE